MKIRILLQRRAGITLALTLTLLAACGDVGNVHVDGSDWPNGPRWENWPWPWHSTAASTATDTLSETIPVTGQRRFRLAAVNGGVAIQGETGVSSVQLTAELQVGSQEGWQDAQAGLSELDLRVTDRGDEIFVQTLHPENLQGRQYRVNYIITVPRHMEVDVHQANGHVTIGNVENSVYVDLGNGNIDCTTALPAHGEVLLTAGTGDLALQIPHSTSAALSARVGIGTITWHNLEFTSTAHTSRSLTGTLGEGKGLIDLETGTGSIAITGYAE